MFSKYNDNKTVTSCKWFFWAMMKTKQLNVSPRKVTNNKNRESKGASQYKDVLPCSIGIHVIKIRRSRDRLIFNMGTPIREKDGLYIETGPYFFSVRWTCKSLRSWRGDNFPNPRYIFPGGRSMKTCQIPMVLHIAARVWGQHWHT